ncbi:MAG: hypothetical protein ACE5R6_07510 [Candidatus Heimdallarchaeota archaeon]
MLVRPCTNGGIYPIEGRQGLKHGMDVSLLRGGKIYRFTEVKGAFQGKIVPSQHQPLEQAFIQQFGHIPGEEPFQVGGELVLHEGVVGGLFEARGGHFKELA